jgi:chemotaxis signal transduction protein
VSDRSIVNRATLLRRAFDRSFAEAPVHETEGSLDLLSIRVAGDRYALRLAEVAGVFVDRVVIPLPTSVPGLHGLAGSRTALIAVYDLAALLGYAAGKTPRWMVTIAGDVPVGLGFEQFDAHVRVPRSGFAADADVHRHVSHVARTEAGVLPVIRLSSVFDEINVRASARLKER